MSYKIKSQGDNGDFTVTMGEDNVVCWITYEDEFSGKASGIFNENTFVIQARNIWHMVFEVLRSDEFAGDLGFDWKGNVVITIDSESFVLKHKSDRFELQSGRGDVVLAMYQSIDWTATSYEFSVEINEDNTPDFPIEELLVCCAYGANLSLSK